MGFCCINSKNANNNDDINFDVQNEKINLGYEYL